MYLLRIRIKGFAALHSCSLSAVKELMLWVAVHCATCSVETALKMSSTANLPSGGSGRKETVRYITDHLACSTEKGLLYGAELQEAQFAGLSFMLWVTYVRLPTVI